MQKTAAIAKPASTTLRKRHTRLTPPTVLAIRQDLAAGHLETEIANRYGVVPETVSLLAVGRTWRQGPWPEGVTTLRRRTYVSPPLRVPVCNFLQENKDREVRARDVHEFLPKGTTTAFGTPATKSAVWKALVDLVRKGQVVRAEGRGWFAYANTNA